MSPRSFLQIQKIEGERGGVNVCSWLRGGRATEISTSPTALRTREGLRKGVDRRTNWAWLPDVPLSATKTSSAPATYASGTPTHHIATSPATFAKPFKPAREAATDEPETRRKSNER